MSFWSDVIEARGNITDPIRIIEGAIDAFSGLVSEHVNVEGLMNEFMDSVLEYVALMVESHNIPEEWFVNYIINECAGCVEAILAALPVVG